MVKAFLFCAAARGAAMPCGCARRTATGGVGLSVTGASAFGLPGLCNSFAFFLFPFSFFFLFSFFSFYGRTEIWGKGLWGLGGEGFSARALRGPRFFFGVFYIYIVRLLFFNTEITEEHRVTQRGYLFIVD